MLDRYRIIVMPEASSDLIQLFEFIELDSPESAAVVIQKLFEAIDSLEQLPHRCKIHRSTKNPKHMVHSMNVSPFIIYYRILRDDRLLEVLTIRHGARKQPRRFK
jgi:plasmid stabilization system protein ParE